MGLVKLSFTAGGAGRFVVDLVSLRSGDFFVSKLQLLSLRMAFVQTSASISEDGFLSKLQLLPLRVVLFKLQLPPVHYLC